MEGKKLVHAQESPMGVELLLEHGNFLLKGRAILGMAPFSRK
jgi:hypothetical protein